MDCRTARLLFEFDRPAEPELEADEACALARHLADCPDCASLRRSEQKADEALGRAMRNLPVPEGLQERILAKLAARPIRRQRRRAVAAVIGLAASIALLLVGWHFWSNYRAPFDPDAVSDEANTIFAIDEVQKRFRENNVAVELPPQFNYDLLVHHGMGELQGRRMPKLQFRSSDKELLWVYVLDGKRFDLNTLASWSGPSRRFTVRFEMAPSGRFGYILIYTGGSLAPFYQATPPPA